MLHLRGKQASILLNKITIVLLLLCLLMALSKTGIANKSETFVVFMKKNLMLTGLGVEDRKMTP